MHLFNKCSDKCLLVLHFRMNHSVESPLKPDLGEPQVPVIFLVTKEGSPCAFENVCIRQNHTDFSKYTCVFATILKGGWLKYEVLFAAVCNCFKKAGNLKLKVISMACLVLHINSTMIWHPSLKNGEIKGKEKNKLWCHKNMCGACGCQLIRNKARQVHTVVHMVCVSLPEVTRAPSSKGLSLLFLLYSVFLTHSLSFIPAPGCWRADDLKHLKSLFHWERKNNFKNYLDINIFIMFIFTYA